MKVKLKEIRKLKDIAIQISFIAVAVIFSVTEFLPSSPSANIFLLIQ